MSLRRSTKVWFGVFVAGLALALLAPDGADAMGFLGFALANLGGWVVGVRAAAAITRRIVRRLSLRLALSYVLIGLVPVPLLLVFAFAGAQLLGHLLIAQRIRLEVQALAAQGAAAVPSADTAAIAIEAGQVASVSLPPLAADLPAEKLAALTKPSFVHAGGEVWLAAVATMPTVLGEAEPSALKSRRLRLLRFGKGSSWLQQLADNTGYTLDLGGGRQRHSDGGFQIEYDDLPETVAGAEAAPSTKRQPHNLADRLPVAGAFIDPLLAVPGLPASEDEQGAIVIAAHTTAGHLWSDLVAQGVPEIGRIAVVVLSILGAVFLSVYMAALALAFFLVWRITRTVNALTRAAVAYERGDFSARVGTRSRDQIGDLGRSFDSMAASMQRLLVHAADKERLEGQLATARTLHRSLMPPTRGELPGFKWLAHVEPAAEIGGDYYDHLALEGDRVLVAIGDVAGHGLPTGLLMAMAKAMLVTMVDVGERGCKLLMHVDELLRRSASQGTMTMALLELDPATRQCSLVNAGHLPIHVMRSCGVDTIELPSLPLGTALRGHYPAVDFRLEEGDRVLLATDGVVEALDPSGDPFGFERLHDLLERESASDGERLHDAILSAVRTHAAGRPLEDDLTFVILTAR